MLRFDTKFCVAGRCSGWEVEGREVEGGMRRGTESYVVSGTEISWTVDQNCWLRALLLAETFAGHGFWQARAYSVSNAIRRVVEPNRVGEF